MGKAESFKNKFTAEELSRPITYGFLLDFTNEYLLPKLGELLDERLEKIFNKRFGDYPKN